MLNEQELREHIALSIESAMLKAITNNLDNTDKMSLITIKTWLAATRACAAIVRGRDAEI
jgi:hypothetical protein